MLVPDVVRSIPEIPAWILSIGAAVGSGVAAYVAQKARADTKVVKQEMQGPGDEPSLRQLVKTHQEITLGQYNSLHEDAVHIKDRLGSMESTVATGIEGRLQALETSKVGIDVLSTAVAAVSDRVHHIGLAVDRHGMNIHLIANAVQAKLLTTEEAAALIQNKSIKDAAAQESAHGQQQK